jgi:hypothetical protein
MMTRNVENFEETQRKETENVGPPEGLRSHVVPWKRLRLTTKSIGVIPQTRVFIVAVMETSNLTKSVLFAACSPLSIGYWGELFRPGV